MRIGNLANHVLSGKTTQSPTRKPEDPFFYSEFAINHFDLILIAFSNPAQL